VSRHLPSTPTKRKPRARRRARPPEERFLYALRPRWEILEAIWQFAIWKVDKARRRKGLPKKSITNVNIWCQLSRAGLIAKYFDRLDYLDKLSCRDQPYRLVDPTLDPRTVTRHVATFKRLHLIEVQQPAPRFNRKRNDWVKQPNVYTFTYAGILWIKKRKSSLTVPLVV
jgi:hypothetical protein